MKDRKTDKITRAPVQACPRRAAALTAFWPIAQDKGALWLCAFLDGAGKAEIGRVPTSRLERAVAQQLRIASVV